MTVVLQQHKLMTLKQNYFRIKSRIASSLSNEETIKSGLAFGKFILAIGALSHGDASHFRSLCRHNAEDGILHHHAPLR